MKLDAIMQGAQMIMDLNLEIFMDLPIETTINLSH